MNQPTKDALREQLALAADRIIALEDECEALRTRRSFWQHSIDVLAHEPWWKRLFSADKCKAACEGDSK